MSTKTSQIEYFLQLLSFVPNLHSRKMFGEIGLYSGFDTDKKFFGIISDSRLFLKATENLKLLVDDDGAKPYEESKMNYFHINENDLEDPGKLIQITLAALDFVNPPSKKRLTSYGDSLQP